MRILLCGINERVVGGVETYLRSLMAQLSGRGHQCLYGYEVPGGSGSVVAASERSHHLSGHPARDAAAFKPDIIFQNSLLDPRSELSVAEVAPVAFYVHAYGGMCISGTRRFAVPGKTVCGRVFGPGCWGPYFVRRCGGLNPATALGLYQQNQLRSRSLRAADVLLCASDYMRQRLLDHGILAERVRTVPYFVQEPASLSSVEDRLGARRLLFLGRMTELKGWPELLEVVALLQSRGKLWTLVVAGDGPDRPRLLQVARHRRLAVEHHPWLESEARDRLIAGCTLLLLPSTWPEPFGLVGLEAARLGVPAVAFDVGGIREWLSPGLNGEIAPPADPSALADATERAVSSEAHYARLSSAAVQMAARFNAARHLEALEEALASAIANRARGASGLLGSQP
jgi:glycosyltransferase involved in cell wall biosynthesis